MATKFKMRNRVVRPETLILEFSGVASADASGVIDLPPGLYRIGLNFSCTGTDSNIILTMKTHGSAAQDTDYLSAEMTIHTQGGSSAPILTAAAGEKAANGLIMDIASSTGDALSTVFLPFGLEYFVAHTTASTGTWNLIVAAAGVR